MLNPAANLRKALERLSAMRPEWSVDLTLGYPELGHDPTKYSSKISWRSTGGLKVEMKRPVC